MAYRILFRESVEENLKRIAHEQVDKAIRELTDERLDAHETVHQVRKRCKKLRGLIRLVRPHFEDTYDRENAWYRDAAHELSYVRDAQSVLDTYDKLADHFANQIDEDEFSSIRQQLVDRRETVAKDEVGLQERLDDFLIKMQRGRDRIDGWEIDATGFEPIGAGLRKTYSRGRRAMKTAYSHPNAENFHEGRKRAKYHWYHARLLWPVWPEVMKKYRDEVRLLGDYLGDDHDLAIFRQTLLESPDDFGEHRDLQALVGLIDRRRLELQATARPLGKRIFFEKPKRLTARLRCYWKAWQNEECTEPALSGRPAFDASSR